MCSELPNRLYGEGLEPQVKKINNSCRLKLLELLREKMEPEYKEVMKDPLFSHIMVIEENGLKFSARLVHSFLCRELMTSKKYEKWFSFARTPLRFSLQEYHAVTGLNVKLEKISVVKWTDDMDFWSKMIKTNGRINLKLIKEKYLEESRIWTWVDRVRMIYLCVIMGVVMGRDEKVNFPHLYMKLAMDLEKLRRYPWGLYSFDFLLKSIDKAKDKLEKKEGYLMEGFLFAFQIWIMEAIPAFGEICGRKVRSNFTGPMCGNWTGCAKCSYQDIIDLETLFPEEGILHSFMDFHKDGRIVCSDDFVRKDEKKDERVDLMLDMIQRKHDWKKHVWGVVETTSSEMDEGDEESEQEEEGEESEDGSETEFGESSHGASTADGAATVSGRKKRKHVDLGAASRKKKLFCDLGATPKVSIDTDMQRFLEGLVQSSLAVFGEKLSQQITDRMDKLETVVTDRLGTLESEVTQLRTALLLAEMAGKTDEEAGPSKSRVDAGPSKSKNNTAPSKKKVPTKRKR
ncbi:hypothetical protein N665_1720s0005 [Sinapis alba]|nr:hypothetical protein N665_1720s0005 [Sinapis alba]